MSRLIIYSGFAFDAVATGLSLVSVDNQATIGAWLLAGTLTVGPFLYYILTTLLLANQAPQVLQFNELLKLGARPSGR